MHRGEVAAGQGGGGGGDVRVLGCWGKPFPVVPVVQERGLRAAPSPMTVVG